MTAPAMTLEPDFLTAEQIAWTLDQRGSLTVLLKKKPNGRSYYVPRYRVVDKDLAALRLRHRQFGGSLYHHSGSDYAWELAQTTLGVLLEEVLPYLTEKRKQAELVLQLIQAKEDGTDRAVEREIVKELGRLNEQS